MSDAIRDAKDAYEAWKESPRGSYLERTIADAIVRDLVPSLIHVAEFPPKPAGFTDRSAT
jgi:hypothetical protein